jgi:hypothetical protein
LEENSVAKKISFPNRACPKCGKAIHIRSQSHPECGWVASSNGAAAPAAPKVAPKKKLGRPKKVHAASNGGGISLEDIAAVKKVVAELGADKVRQLAQVLAK